MISRIRGILAQKGDERLIVDVGGVGYEILVPYYIMRAFAEKEVGSPVELVTYYHVAERQPRPVLIGFESEVERGFFEKLITVSEVGPLRAAKAMIYSVSTIAQAIERGDTSLLKTMPGVSERLAGKIVAALKGKVAKEALLRDQGFATQPTERADIEAEGLEVLQQLGYKRSEARAKIAAAFQRKPSLRDAEELIQEVYRGERG